MTALSRQQIEDKEVIARYLAGQLSDREREEFEAQFVENPALLRELDRTARFKSGLMALRDSGALQKLLIGKPWWQRTGTLAMAASLLLFVIGAGVWLRVSMAPSPILAASTQGLGTAIPSSLNAADTYEIQRTRSSSYDATIKRPANGGAIEVRVKPDTAASPARYRVSIGQYSDKPSDPIAVISGAQPLSNGFVPVYLNSSRLLPGVYELKISGDSGTNGEKSESSFLIELTDSSP